ncbi:Collagen EMF1-alpha [Frankliniella fusca]|nr:Collagen EMF1-alpha [Frankliniella fusca]
MPVPFSSSAEMYCSHTTHNQRMKQLIATIIENEKKLQHLKQETEHKDRLLRLLKEDNWPKHDGICVSSLLQAVDYTSV